MTELLKKKRALVTGGSRGIGAAIVLRFAREGADVVLTYANSPERAEEVVKAAQAFGVRALAIQADSADAAAVEAAVEKTAAELGGIDILVNSAGVLIAGPIGEYKLEDFDRTYAVNVRAVFVASQAALRHMPDGGRIINIGSTNSERVPFGGITAYSMSKSALHGLVQGMARDLGARAITVNNIQPGPIDTEMNPESSEFAKVLKSQFNALPRFGSVEEIAGMAAYLAGAEAGYITGANLMIDGGFSA